MGLDNGFYVKSNKRKITRDMLPKSIRYPFEENLAPNEVEIVYWRKNWGLRNAILNLLNVPPFSDEYSFDIDTPETVIDIICIIASFLDPKKWNEEGESIWSLEEARYGLIQDMMNFALIYGFMLENPDVYLEFYDSY